MGTSGVLIFLQHLQLMSCSFRGDLALIGKPAHPRWVDFYLVFIYNFLSYIRKFAVSLEKDFFHLFICKVTTANVTLIDTFRISISSNQRQPFKFLSNKLNKEKRKEFNLKNSCIVRIHSRISNCSKLQLSELNYFNRI